MRIANGHHPQGYMLMDAVFGLALIAAVITTLTVAVGHQRRGATHFARQRELVHEAEHVLAEMQQGRPALPLHAESTVEVNWLTTSDHRPWVEVRIERESQSATLVGWASPSIASTGATP